MKVCLFCTSSLKKRHQFKYCSNKCQKDHQYQNYIDKWLSGIVNGDRGIVTKNISQYIRRYLSKKYGDKCSLCKWNEKHVITGQVPLEIDHIDGNSENNHEANLRLLCPNCHALTTTFRNHNKGKGRTWRTNKYIKYENKINQ